MRQEDWPRIHSQQYAVRLGVKIGLGVGWCALPGSNPGWFSAKVVPLESDLGLKSQLRLRLAMCSWASHSQHLSFCLCNPHLGTDGRIYIGSRGGYMALPERAQHSGNLPLDSESRSPSFPLPHTSLTFVPISPCRRGKGKETGKTRGLSLTLCPSGGQS